MPEITITQGVIATLVVSGVGGLIGGYFSGYGTNLIGAVLMGIIGGTALTIVLRALEVNPILGIEDYSMLYAFLAGGATAWIVGSFS